MSDHFVIPGIQNAQKSPLFFLTISSLTYTYNYKTNSTVKAYSIFVHKKK